MCTSGIYGYKDEHEKHIFFFVKNEGSISLRVETDGKLQVNAVRFGLAL
jgi:hypothetical protein